jgi:Raf kinase inhibitor-like YbhB/YbcL family protein
MAARTALILALALAGTSPVAAMELSSPDIKQGTAIGLPQVYSKCGGGNASPALSWRGAPAGTKSFAITAFDPDAHGGWWHWIVYNIPANVTSMGAGAPPGAFEQGRNDFGNNEYDGPCPPPGSGTHHYEFTVWALGTPTLPTEGATEGKIVGPYLQTHALAHATLTATYER